MKLLFFLSGENLDLAREEVLALANPKSYKQEGKALVIDGNQFDFSRLAFTHRVCNFVFSCKEKNLAQQIKKTKWKSFYKKNFCVRNFDSGKWSEKDLASLIWLHLKKPKVNLTTPSTEFDFISTKGKVFCGVLILETGKHFKERKAHLRPGFHPSSMNAKLGRAIVNLTGIKPKETLLDPFCGCGGILVEGGMVGAKAIGIDIDPIMLERARKNLDFYKIKNYRLMAGDATRIKVPGVNAIATDPPYGKSSSLHNRSVKTLYPLFMEHAYKSLLKKGSRLCIIFPSKIKVKHRFKEIKHIDYYVHKSLTRRIFILKK